MQCIAEGHAKPAVGCTALRQAWYGSINESPKHLQVSVHSCHAVLHFTFGTELRQIELHGLPDWCVCRVQGGEAV
jgi:hypothetical protein